MAYGLKYTTSFDSFQGQPYTLNISEKDYTGDSETTLLAGVGVTIRANTDEMKPPIKGMECLITKVNLGSLPITAFMSEEDDTFLVEVLWGAQNIFTGYLVQDDFNEDLVDWNHLITLKANDSLGLLKNVTLDEAAITFGDATPFFGQTIEQLASNQLEINGTFPMSPGVIIIIDSGTVLDGTYSVQTWEYTGSETIVTFNQDLNGTVVGPQSATITHVDPVDLTQRMYLSDILALCLKSTGIRLPIAVYGYLYPEDAPDFRLFDNVLMDPTTFNRSQDKWDNCYKIIEDILGRFYYSLFQSDGVWNIVRWDDLRPGAGVIPGLIYTEDFVFDTTTTLENTFTAGPGELTIAETGLNYTPIRAFKIVKEVFQYRNPVLIRNINFTDVGELLSVTTDGTDTITDYAMVGWEQGYDWNTAGTAYIGSSAQRIIRVRRDTATGIEKDRYGVIKGNSGFDDYSCAQSNGVEVVPGDIVKYSFDYKTNTSQPGNVNNYFKVLLLTTVNPVPRSLNNRYVNVAGKWTYNNLLLNNTPSGDNTNVYHTVSVESEPIPFPGLLFLKLAQSVQGNSSLKETHYKNIRFEIVRNIAGNTKTTGHQHRDQQLPIIKNRSDRTIEVDNSPSNALAGTLFYNTFTGPVRDRLGPWINNGNTFKNVGQITTIGELFWHRKTRIKLEGSLKGLVQNDTHMSLLSTIIYTHFADKRSNFGTLDMVLKNGICSFTLWENYETTESITDLKEWYDFKYLYDI